MTQNNVALELIDDLIERRAANAAAVQAGKAPITFNPIRFCRPGELGISRIIAWLLDPSEDHGRGNAFLLEFAKTFGLDPQRFANPKCVLTEARTDAIEANQRRMDIRVECSGYILAIENKPWAAFQHRQIPDYCKDLQRKTRGNYHIVILKGRRGFAPRDQTTQVGQINERILDTDYSGVIEWLEACLRLGGTDRVMMFIESFRDDLAEKLFGQSDLWERRMVMEAIDTVERKRAALELIAAADALYSELHKALVNETRRTCPSGWRISADRAGRSGRANLGYYHITLDVDATLPVVFAVDLPPFAGDAQIGVVIRERAANVARKLDKIARHLDEKVTVGWGDGAWIWWKRVGELAEQKVMALEPVSDAWKNVLEPEKFAAEIVDLIARLKKRSQASIRAS